MVVPGRTQHELQLDRTLKIFRTASVVTRVRQMLNSVRSVDSPWLKTAKKPPTMGQHAHAHPRVQHW